MLDMALTSIKLFLAGKLFQEPWRVFGLSVIGVVLTLALAALLLFALGLSPVAAAAISGLAGGLAQPFLFKDLKYR